ncbi:Na+/H+ antiporter subunit G [Octadecabacter sp. 1_MG-2023]|uniref:Na+/H+ antiporter subunit G n=1 Tax=unclassified Octadecabacter TaxID=196158 RepID=UPI001C09B772|nr:MULTISPECIES: Na+/H+ antiporter subunit G [unclassified Octadecabacter]MBU2991753.1 Na+/H+ antiporter subunit G [Octadecabacter sp. B2R22]MDO6735726.1 Na+/H+ antiporter subunit G [Octadecabacter sp. 1_MG-2023]
MTMQVIGTYAVAFCLLIGAFFMLVGAIGLVKLPDSMTRLHAPTKVGTMGIGALLLASITNSWVFHDGSVHELLIMAFLFVTAPISANFMSKVNIHRKTCTPPPKAPEAEVWSTLVKRDENGDLIQ